MLPLGSIMLFFAGQFTRAVYHRARGQCPAGQFTEARRSRIVNHRAVI